MSSLDQSLGSNNGTGQRLEVLETVERPAHNPIALSL